MQETCALKKLVQTLEEKVKKASSLPSGTSKPILSLIVKTKGDLQNTYASLVGGAEKLLKEMLNKLKPMAGGHAEGAQWQDSCQGTTLEDYLEGAELTLFKLQGPVLVQNKNNLQQALAAYKRICAALEKDLNKTLVDDAESVHKTACITKACACLLHHFKVESDFAVLREKVVAELKELCDHNLNAKQSLPKAISSRSDLALAMRQNIGHHPLHDQSSKWMFSKQCALYVLIGHTGKANTTTHPPPDVKKQVVYVLCLQVSTTVACCRKTLQLVHQGYGSGHAGAPICLASPLGS
eukprot:1298427-Amphidinium_carterae.2